jgi:hypothetical protein
MMASFKVIGIPPFWSLGIVLPKFRGFQTIINGGNPGNEKNPKLQKGHHRGIAMARQRIRRLGCR